MHGQFDKDPEVIPFARARNGAAPGAEDQLDKAGQTILQLVAQAAGIADDNSRQALGMAPMLLARLSCRSNVVGQLRSPRRLQRGYRRGRHRCSRKLECAWRREDVRGFGARHQPRCALDL
jgi:hypothetical protein